jgi:hypothetical protein
MILARRKVLFDKVYRFVIMTYITIPDIIHRTIFYINHNVWEAGLWPRPHVESRQLNPKDRSSLFLKCRVLNKGPGNGWCSELWQFFVMCKGDWCRSRFRDIVDERVSGAGWGVAFIHYVYWCVYIYCHVYHGCVVVWPINLRGFGLDTGFIHYGHYNYTDYNY